MSSDRPTQKSRRRKRLTLDQRAERVLRELSSIGRELAQQQGLQADDLLPIEHLVLPVTVPFGGRRPRAERAAQLLDAYRTRLDEGLRAAVSFRPGRVFCFQCDTSDCPHACPGDSHETFRGYTATGKPQWQSFLNFCLERGEPRVDRLYAEPPEVIAIHQSAGELTDDLLPGFGRGSLVFNVLGQVVLGLLPDRIDGYAGRQGRVALTVQVLETRRGDSSRRLRVNLLGMTLDDLAAAAAERPRGRADRLSRALGAARRQVESLGRRLAEAESHGRHLPIESDVEPLLSRLRSDVEGILRPNPRRTRHAQRRHEGGDRPTAAALRDAREAGSESLFLDVERDTIIILGRRGRAHVFSPEGRHVTSLQLRPGEVDRKTGRKRWQPLSRAQLEAFRGSLEGAGA